MKIYVVRSDFGRYTNAFQESSYVAIGWFDQLIDKSFSREQIKDLYRKVYHKDSNMRVNQNAGQVYRFINDIKIDDIVITPYSDNRLLVGKVTSDVYYEKDTTSHYYLRKKVEWFTETLDRQILSIPLQNTLRSSLTVYTLANGNEILKYYNLTSNAKQKEIHEFNIHETIKRKLLDLDGFEFETLVSYLLQTIGFEKTDEKQGGVADGGIDFEGVLSIYGMAAINLQVQVKRYESNSIKWKDIAAFRGAMKKDYQGCFITLSKFDKKAIENAQDKDKVAINLIDGNKLIDIFISQYDEIITAMREDDNDELADKLKFKKALVPY